MSDEHPTTETGRWLSETWPRPTPNRSLVNAIERETGHDALATGPDFDGPYVGDGESDDSALPEPEPTAREDGPAGLQRRLDDLSYLTEDGQRYARATGDDLAELAADAIAALRPATSSRPAAPELRAALDFRDQPVIDAANDIRKSHAPNEWDSCVACRKAWPCDAELLAELVLTRADALSAPSRSRD